MPKIVNKTSCETICPENPENCSVLNNLELNLNVGCYIERKKEFDRVKKKLKDGNFIQIMAPQGYGKHSFLIRIENHVKKIGFDTVFIDFFNSNFEETDSDLFFKQICRKIHQFLFKLREVIFKE